MYTFFDYMSVWHSYILVGRWSAVPYNTICNQPLLGSIKPKSSPTKLCFQASNNDHHHCGYVFLKHDMKNADLFIQVVTALANDDSDVGFFMYY